MESIKIFDLSQKEEALRILSKRNAADLGAIDLAVKGILADIRDKGDEALFMYTRTFDCFVTDKDSIEVKPAEIKAAYQAVNLRVGVQDPDSDWGLALFVNNLMDTVAITSIGSSSSVRGCSDISGS